VNSKEENSFVPVTSKNSASDAGGGGGGGGLLSRTSSRTGSCGVSQCLDLNSQSCNKVGGLTSQGYVM
jgi:hypothetical protein